MRNDKRCYHCGRSKFDAERIGSTHCNPPFQVQPHLFNGQHPADLIEAQAPVDEPDHTTDAYRYFFNAGLFVFRDPTWFDGIRYRLDQLREWFADLRPGCAYAIFFVLGGFAAILSLIVLGALL
jgi:hypothetical protein